MAKLKNGILGGFSGKVGNVVGANWRGINYIRSLSTKKRTSWSDAQLAQQSKMRLVRSFVNTQTEFVRKGFKNYGVGQSPNNAAVSYNLLNGIEGTYPNLTLQYRNIRVSQGSLTHVTGANVTCSNGNLNFTWEDNSGDGSAKSTDKLMVLAYNDAKKSSVFSVSAGSRSTENYVLSYPAHWVGDSVEVYMSFISENEKLVSNSEYVKSVILA